MKSVMNEDLYLDMKRAGEEALKAEQLCGGFRSNLNNMLEQKRLKKAEVASASNISEKTLWNMRNNSLYIPSLQSVVAVCLGMHLTFSESMIMIELSPYRLRNTNYQDAIYTYILRQDKEISVDEANIYLDALKCEKLGSSL